jgi:phage-related protein
VPGGDGTYYWDSYYTQKPFTIDFAFDDLRDEDIRKLRQMFSKKKLQPLVFDELPYKKYMVKSTAPPQLKYICFD